MDEQLENSDQQHTKRSESATLAIVATVTTTVSQRIHHV